MIVFLKTANIPAIRKSALHKLNKVYLILEPQVLLLVNNLKKMIV